MEILECFSVNISIIYHPEKMREIGSVKTKASLCTPKTAFNQTDFRNIYQLIQVQPDITIHEMRKKLLLQVKIENEK